MAIKEDMEYFTGDTDTFTVYVKDINSALVDLTGLIPKFTVKVNPETDDNAKAVAGPITGTVDPDQVTNKGKLTIPILYTDFEKDPGDYYYDIRLFSADLTTTKKVVMYGSFKLIKAVTR